jgi:exopolysaccharide biosynthesis polyprenyl glycosylphosphotransferase
MLATLIVVNFDEMPPGIASILSLPITVKQIVLLGALAAVWPAVLRMCGVYRHRGAMLCRQEAARVTLACGLTAPIAIAITPKAVSGYFGVQHFLPFWLAVTTVLLATRAARGVWLRHRARRAERVIIVGMGPRGRALFGDLQDCARPKYEVVGFIDRADLSLNDGTLVHRPLGPIDQLESILMHKAIDEVFIALPVGSHYPEIRRTIEICERVGVRAKYRADIVESERAWPTCEDGEGIPVVTMHVAPHDRRLLLKRGVDLVVGITALLLLLPLMVLIAVAIKLTSKGPMLFAQERYGLNRRLFRMYKFRTMVQNAERLQKALENQNEMNGPVFKIRDDPRITGLGQFLRRTSLDELPQLFSVVKGEMSLVGPRPLPVRDVHRFAEAALMRRFSVKPGLTCLWQISGRSNVSFDRWIELDLQYIDRWSLALDMSILIRTIPVVFRGDGAV